MKVLRRRSGDEPGTSLVVDLQERLAVYTREGQIRCKGCGRWVTEEEAQAQRWGYHKPFAAPKLYPYCAECAQAEFGLTVD